MVMLIVCWIGEGGEVGKGPFAVARGTIVYSSNTGLPGLKVEIISVGEVSVHTSLSSSMVN